VLDAADAAWTAELLWSVGLLGVRVGSPGEPGADEIWLLTGEGCAHADLAAAHAAAGGALVALGVCPALREPLSLPPLEPWSDPAAVASLRRTGSGSARAVALPGSGLEWSRPPMNPVPRLAVSRMTGGDLALLRDRLVLFSFDVAAHVLALRQGDPDLAGIDTDGLGGTKPNDLRPFPWSSPTWRQPSADLWVEALAAAVEIAGGAPRDRLWPLPDEADSVVVLVLEQGAGTADEVRAALQTLDDAGVEATVLLREDADASLVRDIVEGGHAVGLQPDGRGLASPREVEALVRAQFASASDRSSPVRSIRHAGALWWGWDHPAALAGDLGLDVLLDFASVGPDFGGPGFAFGAARPVRFRRADGSLLPVLQLPTPVWDVALVGDEPWSQRIADPARLALATEHLMDVAVAWRTPLVVSVDASLTAASDAPSLLDVVLAAAAARALPVLSAERYASFVWDHRRAVAGGVALGSAPQRRWIRAASPSVLGLGPGDAPCASPRPASPLSGTGCLGPVAVELSASR